MFAHRFLPRRRPVPQDRAARLDRRSGSPARREPAPMPRMRWYS